MTGEHRRRGKEQATSDDDRHQEHRDGGIGKRRALVIRGWSPYSRQDQYALGDVEHCDASQQDGEHVTHYLVFHYLSPSSSKIEG